MNININKVLLRDMCDNFLFSCKCSKKVMKCLLKKKLLIFCWFIKSYKSDDMGLMFESFLN